MPVDLLANPKFPPQDLLKSPPRDLLSSEPKERNLLGEGIKATGKFAIDVGKEAVAQLSDLMKVPAAVAGLPHLPWQSKLVTEDPSITFHLPEFTLGSKGFIPTSKEYTIRPFDLAIGALLVGQGVQGFKYGQSVNEYNKYLAKEFQSANVKSAVKENIGAFNKILSKQGITLPENMSTEDRVRVVLSQAERSPTLKGAINNLAAGKIKPVSPVSGEVIETTGAATAPKPSVLPIQPQPGEAIAPKATIVPQITPLAPITPKIVIAPEGAETPVSGTITPEGEALSGQVVVSFELLGKKGYGELLETYKGQQILRLQNGEIATYEPNTKKLFRVSLDDSTLHHKIVPEANNIQTAKKYLDWLTEGKTTQAEQLHVTQVKDLITKYDNGDTKVSTIEDIVDGTEDILSELTQNGESGKAEDKIIKAIDKFRREQELDKKLGKRGDMDMAREKVMSAINKYVSTQATKSTPEGAKIPTGEGIPPVKPTIVKDNAKRLTLLGRVMKVGINKKAVMEKFGKEYRQFSILRTPGVVRKEGRDPTEWYEEFTQEGIFTPNEWEGAKLGGSGPGEYFLTYFKENARKAVEGLLTLENDLGKEYNKWLEKQKAEGVSDEDVKREQRAIEEDSKKEVDDTESQKALDEIGSYFEEQGWEVQVQIHGTEPAMPETALKAPPQKDLFQQAGELFEPPKDLLSGRKGFINIAAFNPTNWDEIREFIEDDWLRVKRLIQEKGANVTETNNPYEAEIRYWGRVGTRMEEADKIITEIDKDILTTSKKIYISDKVLTKEINDFLIARHAPERNAVHGENAAGITDQEAYQRRADIAGKPYAAEVERLANKIQELSNKTLDILFESEVVSKELYDKLRTMYKNHVPLNRVMSENDDIVEVLTRRGFAVQGAGLKRAKGSELEVSDILTNVIANYKSVLVRSEKNILDNFTLRFARENNYFDGLFEEVELPMMPVGTVEHREAVDAVFMNDLAKFAESLGATFQTKGMPGRTLGTYSPSGKLITRKFATPREVQSHETAHFFDHKYGLRQRFYKRGESKAMAEEMLKHMETRGENANRMKQTGERFADAFEWWLTHRDLAKRDLPLFSQEMKNIINEIPGLKPILKIEPTAGFSIEKLEQMVFARQKYATDPHILPLREKGNQVYLKINDPQLAMALRGVNRHKVEGLIRAVKVFTRFYSGLMTRFNPEFVASNKIRDIQEMAVYLASKNEIGFKGTTRAVSKDPQSIKDIIDYMRGKDTEGARLYKQMKMDGGTTGGLALSTKEQVELDFENIKRINRSNPRKVAQIIIKSVDKWNTIFEDSTRLSVYKQVLKQGISRNKAAVLAKESTINFNKLGTGSPVINALYMFSNASVQGSVKLLRALRNPKVLGVVLTLMGGAVALIAEWNDEQDKNWREKVSKWDKLNGLNIVIPTDKGIKYVTIPIAWGLKPIKVMFEEVFDLAGGYNKSVSDAVGGVMTALMEGYNPAGGTDVVSAITPSILDVPVDVARNRSWTGGRIKPDWNNSDAESIKYFDNLKKKLSGQIFINATRDMGDKGIEISPADMNYAYESYIGGAGRFVNKVFNTVIGTPEGKRPIKEIPFASRFYRDIPEEEIREYGEDFKDLRKKLRDQDKTRFYLDQAAEVVYAGLKDLPPERANENLYEIYQTNRSLYEKIRDVNKDEVLKLTYTERLIGKLGVENGERAKHIWENVKKLKTDNDKNIYLKSLYDKKILTDRVYQQLKNLFLRKK